MKIVIPKETVKGENRVAIVPDSVGKLTDAGFEVIIESKAGEKAFYSDHAYENAGAEVTDDIAAMIKEADVVAKIHRPMENPDTGLNELDLLPENSVLIGFLETLFHPEIARQLADRKITSFSMDAVPRIARAQSMDALSSMSSVGGYKAVLIAANSLGRYFPMMMTAAGTVPPAQGLILGAGVAGLQAIATARRLGASVEAFDIRPEVKEQVESLGATFVEVDYGQDTEDEGGYAKELQADAQQRQREKIHERVKLADFVVTTALIPGRTAPTLITKEMVADMKPGSVIVDMTAVTGGNCELSETDQTVTSGDIIIHGPSNLPSTLPTHASRLYSQNLTNLLLHLVTEGEFLLDFEDSITGPSCITHDGTIRHERTKSLLEESSQ